MHTKNKNQGPQKMSMVEGLVKRHPDGFGFLIPHDPEKADVFIPRKFMKGVMTNDIVVASVFPEPGGQRFRGEVVKISKRSFERVMGHLQELGSGRFIIYDESHAWGADLVVEVDKPGLSVQPGDWGSVEIIDYPDSDRGFRGRLVEVLGDVSDAQIDNKRVLLAHNIPYLFGEKCLAEANSIGTEVREDEFVGRQDLRNLPLITIDGVTAKDFDDAVYVEQNREGFLLYVAIADVSHYVKSGSAIDEDAYTRGTSTYFPGFVAPMLPESLSNEICSLKPNVNRLCMVAKIQMDFQGNFLRKEFFEAVMKSHARVTYGEAQEIIDDTELEEFSHVKKEILAAADLAKILMAKRFKEGALNLEIPEDTIEIDEAGEPQDIIKAERVFAHKLIEELMLVANVAVAEFLNEKAIPALFRIHEEPKPEAISLLENYLNRLGESSRFAGGKIQKKITRALQKFQGHPQESILNILTLRSMNQAKYSPDNIGHFGLGFSNYCHFTSPIRRYPDLIIHRLLKSQLYPEKGYRRSGYDELETAGVMLSACEQRSVKAERQIDAIKKARFMRRHLGKTFEAMISSVAKFGAFVVLREFAVDGLVKLEELGSGLEYDAEELRLFNSKSGLSYSIGDPIEVIVAGASIDVGQIDFVLAHPPKKNKEQTEKSGIEKKRFGKEQKKFKSKDKTNIKRKSQGESSKKGKKKRKG